MTRYTITLPHYDNEGNALGAEHETLKCELLAETGGYSSVEIDGAWTNADGAWPRTFHDSSTRYETIVDSNADLHARILAIAQRACAAARQECVLLTHEPTTALFIGGNS